MNRKEIINTFGMIVVLLFLFTFINTKIYANLIVVTVCLMVIIFNNIQLKGEKDERKSKGEIEEE